MKKIPTWKKYLLATSLATAIVVTYKYAISVKLLQTPPPQEIVSAGRLFKGGVRTTATEAVSGAGIEVTLPSQEYSFIATNAKQDYLILSDPDFDRQESWRANLGLPSRAHDRRNSEPVLIGAARRFGQLEIDWPNSEAFPTHDGVKGFHLDTDGFDTVVSSLEEHPNMTTGRYLKLPQDKTVIRYVVPVRFPESFVSERKGKLVMYYTDAVANHEWALFAVGLISADAKLARPYLPFIRELPNLNIGAKKPATTRSQP